MLEHMMFRGTKQVPQGQFNQLIAAHGGEQNAMTTTDLTGYYQVMGKQYLPLSFRLEADRMRHLLLLQGAFNKERQVVEEERLSRVDDNPMALLNEHVLAAAWLNNPYRNPVIGWQSDIAQYQLSDLWRWYHQWYQPNNAVIVVVGDVTPKAVFALAKQYLVLFPLLICQRVNPTRCSNHKANVRCIFAHRPSGKG
jgi:zinc protease